MVDNQADQYIEKQYKYDRDQRRQAWGIAFGLQQADNLTPSKYVETLADENISGVKDYQEIQADLTKYYADQPVANDRVQEADFSSVRIAELLNDETFQLTPVMLKAIHKHLFKAIPGFDFPVGEYRTGNISKAERILNDATVQYTSAFLIEDTIQYEMDMENKFDFTALTPEEIGDHVMRFISSLWQVHAFREGNTRTLAVFALKYLQSLGFEQINNQPLAEHATYFRDALVAANAPQAVQTKQYLQAFTQNLLFKGTADIDQVPILNKI
ncbi:MAG: Fic family protein [Lactobacillaceae bacterium]|jgi:fido (protein-threonine AMPylation protein)|nr:Fic family protein [Lactobacillaceae bacterium]